MAAVLSVLIIFSAQLLVVIGVAVLAEALGRVAEPRLRLAYWRGVALACLALPLSAFAGVESPGPGATFLAASLKGGDAFQAASALPSVGRAAWWLVCAGALVRFGWLFAGAVRLRQLRKRSLPIVLAPDLEAIRSGIAPRAEVRVSRQIAQPAGFGLRHPVVLLPQTFFAMVPEAQRTVACHELLHVARRDWPWIAVEEVARALFWFHPAVWLLVERIQESREQLVDRLVVARIPSKRAYMTALLAFADAGHRPATLTTAFLRRRHLRSRLRKLGKESVMSRKRLVWTAVVLVCVMSGAIAGTVRALPLGSAVPQQEQVLDGKDPGITLPKVVSEVKPRYTAEAIRARIEGTVTMTTIVRTDGTPTDIEITTSLDSEHGLDNEAVAALKQWRFEPGRKDGKPVNVRVSIEMRFSLKK
jgi:TonB family protein